MYTLQTWITGADSSSKLGISLSNIYALVYRPMVGSKAQITEFLYGKKYVGETY